MEKQRFIKWARAETTYSVSKLAQGELCGDSFQSRGERISVEILITLDKEACDWQMTMCHRVSPWGDVCSGLHVWSLRLSFEASPGIAFRAMDETELLPCDSLPGSLWLWLKELAWSSAPETGTLPPLGMTQCSPQKTVSSANRTWWRMYCTGKLV